ncbi:MAG: Mur ligase domain-containing protein, partial [Prevotellaceae bacterium]|nr:Mur ligase domain-containing protein [Prevotellaceae bacterium]
MYKNYYFLGIGGIGMSAIARYFNAKGAAVAGYDRVRSELCAELEAEGIDIHYVDDLNLIDKKYFDKTQTLVIYTPAIPQEHTEYQYFKQQGFRVLKRAEILGEITKTERGLCVAGTHGKTSISTMTAHLFAQSSIGCSAFLGGISLNYGTNLLLNDKTFPKFRTLEKLEEKDFVVIEADEYDRSFHQLTPFMAVISATDADHLDIYHTHAEYIAAFEKFASLISDGGALVINKKIVDSGQWSVINGKYSTFTYSATDTTADFHADNIKIENGQLTFDFTAPSLTTNHLPLTIKNLVLGVPIFINVENAVAAMALAWLNGMSEE